MTESCTLTLIATCFIVRVRIGSILVRVVPAFECTEGAVNRVEEIVERCTYGKRVRPIDITWMIVLTFHEVANLVKLYGLLYPEKTHAVLQIQVRLAVVTETDCIRDINSAWQRT